MYAEIWFHLVVVVGYLSSYQSGGLARALRSFPWACSVRSQGTLRSF
jgi:hypothetical protein